MMDIVITTTSGENCSDKIHSRRVQICLHDNEPLR